jgi:tRNA-guanine family transglycosylase
LTASGKAINLSFSNGVAEIIDLNPIGTRSTRITPKDEFKTSRDILQLGCGCKTCAAGHTKAYLHHLLCVNDMCAFVLLAQHNYFMFDGFIEQVREAIKAKTFDTIAQKWL